MSNSRTVTISLRRWEAIGFVIAAGAAVLLVVASVLITNSTFGGDELSEIEVAHRELLSGGLLNLASELGGAILIYVIFKVFLAANQTPESALSPSEAPWKKPLMTVVEALIHEKKIDSSGIGLFSRFKLDDGTPLLEADEIRQLRSEHQDRKE